MDTPIPRGNDTPGHGPLFIGGLDRSGKTYMRLMLSSHPDLVFSKRTNLWTQTYNKFGNLAQADNFERCLKAMLRHKHIRSLEPNSDRLRRDFRQGPPGYARLFSLLHEQYAERQGKRRWGDQTELIERFAEPIFAAYPNARMIHMIRDPRDRYEAAVARRPQTKGKVGFFTAQWLHSATLATHNQRQYLEQYKVVRYESLVAQPEETLDDVCRFLGEAYLSSMLAMENAPRFRQGRNAQIRLGECPLSTDFIGRYRQGLSKYEIAFIQHQAARPMHLYGYPLEPIQLAAGEKARFYSTHWAANVAQMVGWRALSAGSR